MGQYLLPEGAAPSTPAAGYVSVYAKTDGKIYSKDDAGVETVITHDATLYALLAGSSTQTFSVAAATAAAHAMPLSQSVGRNKFVNAEYKVSQVNADTAHTITAAAAINYGIDGWYTQCTGQDITAQRIAGTAPFRYAYKLLAGATGPTTTLHGQRIEGKDVAYLESGDVSVKVGIICDVARTVTWTAYYATVEDTFSTKTQIATGSISATTSQANYSFTFNAGANAKLGLCIEYTTDTLTNSTGYITYSGHQIESGVSPTAYEHIRYKDALEMSKRYLPSITGELSSQEPIGIGYAYTTAISVIHVYFSVPARRAPTGIFGTAVTTPALINIADGATVQTVATAVNIALIGASQYALTITATGTPLTIGQGSWARFNSTNGRIFFDGCRL